jgi:hypothetical protein
MKIYIECVHCHQISTLKGRKNIEQFRNRGETKFYCGAPHCGHELIDGLDQETEKTETSCNKARKES